MLAVASPVAKRAAAVLAVAKLVRRATAQSAQIAKRAATINYARP